MRVVFPISSKGGAQIMEVKNKPQPDPVAELSMAWEISKTPKEA